MVRNSGPAGVDVPVIFTASAGLTPNSASSADLIVDGRSGGGSGLPRLIDIGISSNGSAGRTHQSAFSIATPLNLNSDDAYRVFMQMQLVASPAFSLANVSGFIDPIISIDPSFARAGEFQVGV